MNGKSPSPLKTLFDLENSVAVVTGGGGVLCAAISRALAQAGVKVALLDLSLQAAEQVADQIHTEGGQALAIRCDVLDEPGVKSAAQTISSRFGRIDLLINGAGGNHPAATTSNEQSFFKLSPQAVERVFRLNFLGTLIPSQVFADRMVSQGNGVILNISSMNAIRPLTRIPAYSSAKAAVSNFTQWLAVHLAQEYSPGIRVNAIAPGFFITDQNRFLLTDPATGNLTARGQGIIDHTPQGRFGIPEDLLGTVFWLLSPASAFVTGIVVPIDGGFSAFSGV